MLVEALQTYLAGQGSIQFLIGTPATRTDKQTGIFPTLAPDTVPAPYIVLSQVSGEPGAINMKGTNNLQIQRWRFSCYGSTYKAAKNLARVVRLVLLSLDGSVGNGTYVSGSWHKLEADDAQPIPHGTIYSTHLDFEIIYTDTDVALPTT